MRRLESVKRLPLLLAKLLARSWRCESPPPLDISPQDLADVLPLLVGSGASALVFRRLRGSGIEGSAPYEELRQATRLQTLQAAIHEESIASAFRVARAEGAEPILLKGWAVARLYPESWLRPAGDLDLLFRPVERARAEAALRAPDCGVFSVVDLKHSAFDSLTGREWEGLYERSESIQLAGESVRVLGRDDQFRYLCEHLWKHSAYRPIWLCDVAAALESRGPGFDWEQCLDGNKLIINRVGCAVGMACRLLGAEAGDLPNEVLSVKPPEWLVTEVLKQWESPCTEDHLPEELMAISLKHPSRVIPALLARWPDPIRASVGTRTYFDNRIRLPKQLTFFTAQATRFLRDSIKRATS